MLAEVESAREYYSKSTQANRKSELGQFLTPANTAQFMAELFRPSGYPTCQLLDPGAGIGSLSSAFLERCVSGMLSFSKIEATAIELDPRLHQELNRQLSSYKNKIPVDYEITCRDFVEQGVRYIQAGNTFFTHTILNPPYKKITSNSHHRLLLRQVGIETVNLYSAFVALALELLGPGGQLVAIIPRSFCNGPYYRPFRDFILGRAALHHVHLFDSRSKTFKDDEVLQENVIILLERGGQQHEVAVSTSTDGNFDDLAIRTYPFEQIVAPSDPEGFIRVPTTNTQSIIELSDKIRFSLDEIGISVSTGPVVDFRLKEYLLHIPALGTVPLIYPGHANGQYMEWPNLNLKKPNAIYRNSLTEKWLYPNGFYCLVRRFSSKEEKRRIVASVVRPEIFKGAELLGFENHLNVFHENKHTLPEALAHGLAAFLNTTALDKYFRRFSGHTQVNATDLKMLKYPSRQDLTTLGEWAIHQGKNLTQTMLDNQLDDLLG